MNEQHDHDTVRTALSRILTATVLIVAVCCSMTRPVFGETSNRIVAVVGDEVITEADITSRLQTLQEQLQEGPLGEAPGAEMHRLILRQLVEQRLILQEARAMELTIGQGEVEKQLEVLRLRFGSEEALRQSLSEAGLSRAQLKEQVRESLLVKRAIDVAVRSKITISPSEIARALEERPERAQTGEFLKVFHILVRVNESRDAQAAQARIAEAHQALRDGTPFPEVARRYSEDPHAEAGGAMGWMAHGILMPELDTTLASLAEGEFSSPIQTQLGFHIVKVGGRRTVSPEHALTTKQAVEMELLQRKFQVAFARWLDELSRNAYIEIRPAPPRR